MATYVVGDVQGCFRTLETLMAKVGFSATDRLWMVGDLVNRGPGSLEVLRWASAHRERVTAVLGNHDLHLLAVAAGMRTHRRGKDTLKAVLNAPDRNELLSWLRSCPFVHREGRFLMVHAGLLPDWSWDDAERLGAELSHALGGGDPRLVLERRDAAELGPWSEVVQKPKRRLRLASAAMTRVRCLTLSGQMDDDFNGHPSNAPEHALPWFEHPDRPEYPGTVLVGHWAGLGFLRRVDVIALDSGCVWGRELTAIRLDDLAVFQQPSLDT